jgi:hypothetical protein
VGRYYQGKAKKEGMQEKKKKKKNSYQGLPAKRFNRRKLAIYRG